MGVLTGRAMVNGVASAAFRGVVTAIALAGITACGSRTSDASRTIVAMTGAVNAGAGVAAHGADVVVTWAATKDEITNVYAARSRDGGATFDAPLRVNDRDGDARVNGEQAPRVAWGRDLVVAWTSRASGVSEVRLARSTDGRTFAPALTAHEAGLTGARGWVSLAADPRTDAIHLGWLDGRNASASTAHVHGEAGGAMDHHGGTRQDAFHATWSAGQRAETLVATNVCFCCKTSVAVGADGAVYLAFRNIYPTNLRDMAVARSNDGGVTFSEPTRVSEDGWQIDACPEDGPSLAVDGAGVVHIAWPTLVPGDQPKKGIFYSFSVDGGRTFAPRMRIDEPAASGTGGAHPQLAVNGSQVVIAWDEPATEGRQVRMRVVSSPASARTWTPAAMSPLTVDAGQYPSVAATARGFVVAWTTPDAGGSRIAIRAMR